MDRDDLNLPVVALVVLFLVANAGLVAGVTTSGTTLGPFNDDWDGGSTLEATVDETGDSTLARSTDAYRSADADSTVGFVLLPSDPYRGTDAARLQQFLSNGGTLVVAGEGPGPANRLLRRLGAEIRFEASTLRDERFNDGQADLPRAANVSDHSLVADVDRLTLSRGTALDIPGVTPGEGERAVGESETPESVDLLVRSSEFAYLDLNDNATLDDSDPIGSYPVAAMESVGDGRVIAVSDATLFTNAMLERDGNREFVRALAGSGDRVVLDYSHRPPFPPLTYLLVQVRGSPLAQALVGVLGLAGIGLWLSRSPGRAFRRAVERARPDRPTVDDAEPDPDALAAAVRERHPEWDDEQVERVAQTIKRQRRE